LVSNGSKPETFNRQFDFREIARLPEVVDATQMSYYFGEGKTAAGRPITEGDLSLFASDDGRFGTALNGARVLHGRMPTRDNEFGDVAACRGSPRAFAPASRCNSPFSGRR
jgi:hypothetical protein